MNKWIKRLIAIALSAVFLLSIPVFSYENLSDASALLSALEIMQNEADGTFGEEKIVTRAEFIHYVLQMFRQYSLKSETAETSLDLTSTHKYYNDIMIAYNYGMITKVHKEFFSPDSAVSPYDISRAVMSALGYDVIIGEGKTDTDYYKMAVQKNLFTGVGFKNAYTKRDIASVLYNAMRIYPITASGENKFVAASHTKMQDLHIEKGSGVITANEYSSLVDDKIKAPQNSIVIDDRITIEVGDTNAAEYLGYKVDYFYYTVETEEDARLIAVIPNTKNIMSIKAKDIVSFDKSTHTFSYYGNGINRKAHIDADADVVFNGIALADYIEENLVPENGYVTLYSNNASDYNVVFVTSYIDYVVDSVLYSEKGIYDMYGKEFLDLEGIDNLNIFDKSGNKLEFEAITERSVVSVMAGKEKIENGRHMVDTANSEKYTLVVSTDTAAGEVTAVDKSIDEPIYIDGIAFDFSKSFKNEIERDETLKPQLGSEIIVYLNSNGEVSGCEISAGGSWKYAFLIKSGIESGISNRLQVKIIDERGKTDVYYCKNKIRVDGVSGVNVSPALEAKLQFRLIGYRQNSNGEIYEIDTDELGENESEENSLYPGRSSAVTCQYSKSSLLFDVGTSGDDTFSIDSRVKVFVVPPDGYSDKDEDYAVYGAAHFNDYSNYYVRPYNMSHTNQATIMLEYASPRPSVDNNTGVFMIKKLIKVVNKDGEEVYEIIGTSLGKELSYNTTSEPVTIIDYTNVSAPTTVTEGAENLKTGDIIRAVTDSLGEVYQVERVFCADNYNGTPNQPFGKTISSGGDSGYRKQFIVYFGRVYAKNGGTICLNLSNDGISSSPLININYSKDIKITCYDSKLNKVNNVSLGDLVAYYNTKDEINTSTVFAYLKYANPMDLYLIK